MIRLIACYKIYYYTILIILMIFIRVITRILMYIVYEDVCNKDKT